PAAAAKRLEAFVAKNPGSREGRLNYARALVLDKRFPEARKQFEALLAANPGNTDVIYAVGLLAYQLKDYPVAEENMKRLLGLGYREANHSRDAFELLGQALKKDPEQPDLLYDMALTAEKLERYEQMESNLRKLIEVQPEHAHAYNALGYSFAERNTRLAEAKKLIEKALELSPEDYFIIDSLGWVLYREGD